MPIVTLQRQMREIGRIRAGQQVASSDGKRKRPTKLEVWRLTSRERALIDAAAAVYGGVVTEWREGDFEVVTTTDVLPILVPPWQALSQWFELWSAGGCQRRCDGRTEVLTDSPCKCPADPAERRAGADANPPTACKPTTRLNIILPDLPDLGVWRLESHGFYAAVELAGAAQLLELATRAGQPLPARLRLDQRTKKVPGQPTNRYAVPVIEILGASVGELLAAVPDGDGPMMLGPGGRARTLEAPETPLPDASDFRAPPADPGDSAEANDAASVPGPTIDRETFREVVESGRAVTISADYRAAKGEPTPTDAGPAGLTSAALAVKLREAKISVDYAAEVAKVRFGGWKPGDPMTDAQRLDLWKAVERAAAGERI